MKMLQNKIDCESLETSQENICNGVYFNKGASLKCRDCNSTINRLHYRFFSDYDPTTRCLKQIFWEKSQWWSVLMKLLPYSEQAAALLKMGLIVDVSGTGYPIKQKHRYNTIK